MYRGFNLTLNLNNDLLFQKGRTLNAMNKQTVKRTLDSFISPDGSINGSKMQTNWFPQVDADIFISHSHRDEKMAITLAGLLKEKFGLSSFIDSCIWGYSNDLLKQIDDKHCLNPSGDTYSYEKRNSSTSHVHMMLSTALNMMIDKTECLFFLNTPNSITTKDIISQTISPWIYSEIATTKIIEKKAPGRIKDIIESYSNIDKHAEMLKGLTVTYEVDLSHFASLNMDQLNRWEENKNPNIHHLDTLYNLYPPKKISNQLFK